MVVEKEIAHRTKQILREQQSQSQYGFTEGRSPSMCALALTEAIAEAADQKAPLYVTFLDVKKAFDTVSHDDMMLSLYQQGVRGTLWNVYKDMYTDIRAQIKSGDELSREFYELQGIRQGGLTSTVL